MTSYRSREFSSLSSSSPTTPGASFSRRRERSYSPSSRYGACSSPTRGVTAGRNSFSSSSLTGYGSSAYPKVSYNKRLLTPLNLDIDPSLQAIRAKEKDEIKTLNNQFAALIGKVQSLEQHNQILLTRWSFLREQDNSLSDLDIKLLYDQYMNKLRQQIRSIDVEKEQLDLELDEVLDAMDSFRSKYEDEINKRSAMEFTFTTLKKDLDNGFLHKTELEAKLNGLHAMAELMKTIHEQELEEAMSQIKDISVVLGIDNNRIYIDPHRIVEDVRSQYEALAIRSWEELEALTRSKLSEGELQSAKYGDHLLHNRRIIAELNIQIQKMRSCILSLKSQCLRLEGTIKEVGSQGEAALNDAKAKLASLEEALQNLRQDLAHLVKEYQELMNIKLALDIEILTYRELMEGEEISMESPAFAFISRIYSGPKFSSSHSSVMTTSNTASRAREDSAERMSHRGGALESGLSRSQSGSTSGGDFSRSHSNVSGGAPKALKNHSSTSRGTLESSLSRSPSSRSGNLADIENTTESSVSRSHGSGSFSQPGISRRDNVEGGLSRSASGGTSEGSLSRSQSNRSGALTDSVFARTTSGASEGSEGDSRSRNQSHRSVGFSPSSFIQTQSGEGTPESAFSRDASRGSSSTPEGTSFRSQRDRTESGFVRTQSGESKGVSEGSLSRSQSDKNEEFAEPNVLRTNTAEDGGVPVGGIPRSHSRASRGSSEGRLSRSQSDKNESPHSHGSESYAEATISKTNSAEDGGVPVGGISRSHNVASRYTSEDSFSRSQSEKAESQSSKRRGGSVEPTISRTNSAEDGGVPVGVIPRSQSDVSRYNPDRSLPKCHSGEDDARSTHKREAYAEPTVYRTGSLSRSLRDQSGVSRSQSDGARGTPGASGFRTPSVTSAALTDSVFLATPCSAGEDVHEDMLSRVHSGTTENVPEAGLSRSRSGGSEGPVETSTPICYSSRNDEAMERGLSRSHSGESGSFRTADSHRSPSGASRSGLSRNCSKETDSISEGKLSRNDSYLTAVSHPGVSRTYSSEAEDNLCSSPSGGVEAPVSSPGDGNETIPQRGLGGSHRHK
ncbi:hornerin-like [Eublepharis macularius]|uniref:Hornerin-like n=1 Tax=Eublepharis macularius TaxID=481883 RepID=A0AA97LL12_EUBMA|nr:hornerin-like [Eublepharis macularius]